MRTPRGTPPTTTCNARAKHGLCKEPAGKNTEHEGYGRCWKHGGKSIVPGTGKQLQLPTVQSLKTIVDRNKNDPDIFNLRREVAISRGVTEYVQQMILGEDDTDVVNSLLRTLNVFLGTTTKIVDKLHEIENGRRYLISVEDVKRVVEDMIAIVQEEIPDAETRMRILNRIMQAHSNGAIVAPPENYRYAEEYYASLDEEAGLESRDQGEEVVHRLNQAIADPLNIEKPERISLAQHKKQLKISEDSLDTASEDV